MEQTVIMMTNTLMSTVQNDMIFNKVHYQTSQLGINFNIKVWTLQPGTLLLQCVKTLLMLVPGNINIYESMQFS